MNLVTIYNENIFNEILHKIFTDFIGTFLDQ